MPSDGNASEKGRSSGEDASDGNASDGNASEKGRSSGEDASDGNASDGNASEKGRSSGEDASDGNASDGNASEKGRSNASSISVNNLRANEISTPIANAAVQTPTSIPNQTELEALGTYQGGEHESLETLGTNQGREHESLETANNDAIIRKQIKEAADAETDPTVKANLMEEYEALK